MPRISCIATTTVLVAKEEIRGTKWGLVAAFKSLHSRESESPPSLPRLFGFLFAILVVGVSTTGTEKRRIKGMRAL